MNYKMFTNFLDFDEFRKNEAYINTKILNILY